MFISSNAPFQTLQVVIFIHEKYLPLSMQWYDLTNNDYDDDDDDDDDDDKDDDDDDDDVDVWVWKHSDTVNACA